MKVTDILAIMLAVLLITVVICCTVIIVTTGNVWLVLLDAMVSAFMAVLAIAIIQVAG